LHGNIMRKIILNSLVSLCFCVFFLFAGCATLPESYSGTCAKPEVLAEFKISADVPAILLPVTFDGKEYDFLLDTGASRIIFDVSLKDKLGKRFLWPKKGKAAGGKPVKLELFRAPQAYLGPLNLRDCGLIAVVDLEPVSSVLGRKVHGLIGMDFLKKYTVQIDFDEGLISFHKPTSDGSIFSFLRPQKNVHPDWGKKIPIKYKLFSSLPYINGNIDGNTVTFLVDTGFWIQSKTGSVSLSADLESKVFEKVSSETFSRTRKIKQVTLVDQTHSVSTKFTVVAKSFIGSLEYKDVIFEQSDDSILGIPFLSRHLVTFDFPNNRLYLKKGEGFDRPGDVSVKLKILDFEIQRKGGSIYISSIDPNSLAYEKGIRQNDVLLKVDDQDVSAYGLAELVECFSQLHKQEDEIVTFTLKRGNDIINVSFGKNDIMSENNGTD